MAGNTVLEIHHLKIRKQYPYLYIRLHKAAVKLLYMELKKIAINLIISPNT
mgnify:CR=1 FL=1